MKNLIENIKEFKKTKNGNMILFFGFYLIFFAVIFLLVRLGGGRGIYSMQEYEKGRPKGFDTSGILSKNFYFDYNIYLDGVNYNYYGKKNSDVESFKYNNQEYYRNKDDFFVDNGTWVKTDNPYIFSELIDPDNISKIIENAYFESKDVKNDKKYTYNYLISTNTINKLIYSEETDFDEVPNKIIVVLDIEDKSNLITINLDSFCKMTGKCSELVIKNKYEMFNSVKSIDNPIE